MSDTKQRSTHKHLGGLLAALLCVLAALLLLANRQPILDQLSVWQFAPSSEIESFVERSGMNDTGKFYFYTSHPSLQDAKAFNAQCDRKEESTAILGCYNGQFIYIYNVPNPVLDGIREVTAAHEMLHVAYARMNDAKKQEVNKLLEVEYAKLAQDEKFAQRMAFYARTEPGERDNELHSLIGTEVAMISSALEEHYADYFADRSKVVALHEKYASIFSDLQARGEVLSNQLTELKVKIEAEAALYNKDIAQFNQDVETYERRGNNDEFSSQAEIDAARDALLARGAELDSRRRMIQSESARFDSLRAELESIASQSEALNHSIDSSLAPAPSL
jgi:hypothetical protein